MTSDLQRMHQDEWLSALRGAEAQGRGSASMLTEPRCALGRAVEIARPDITDGLLAWTVPAVWLGISDQMEEQIWRRNDDGASFDEIADFFKAERDAHNGDLSEWTP